MRAICITAAIALLFIFCVAAASAETRPVFLREDFNDLAHWRPLFFPKIKQHSQYTIEKDGDILGSLCNFDNVFVTEHRMNRGWAEVMKYLVG